MIRALDEKKTEYHTYCKKQDKPFRVVLRYVRPTIDITELKHDIEKHGHTVLQITNIRQQGTKKPLPLFFVDLKTNENNKEIYKIEFLLNDKVKVEPPKPKREIVQCTRCQRYGHTKNFCTHQHRCVKCAQNHATADCPRKTRSDDVKCVLCGGNHSANYKGCPVYKQLQETKYPALRKKVLPSANQQQTATATQNNAGQTITYAQMISKNQQKPHVIKNPLQPQPQPHLQSNDLQELKNMVKELMEQMSTMLNILTAIVTKMASLKIH